MATASDLSLAEGSAQAALEELGRRGREVEFQRLVNENADLRIALESRDVIGTAKGILMEREGVTVEEAFQMLVTASQRANRKLRDIAEELVRRTQESLE